MKCQEIYEAVLEMKDTRGYLLFELADCFLNGFDPEKLRDMLQSNDDGIVSDGLFVCGEIGHLAKKYLTEFAKLYESEDRDISQKAESLLRTYG